MFNKGGVNLVIKTLDTRRYWQGLIVQVCLINYINKLSTQSFAEDSLSPSFIIQSTDRSKSQVVLKINQKSNLFINLSSNFSENLFIQAILRTLSVNINITDRSNSETRNTSTPASSSSTEVVVHPDTEKYDQEIQESSFSAQHKCLVFSR